MTLRDLRDEAHLRDPLSQAEHEVTMSSLACRAGVNTPAVVGVHRSGSQVWIVQEWIDGGPLESVPAGELSDEVLDDCWRQVALLHGAGITHRDLDPSNVVIDGAGRAWLVDFAHAAAAPPAFVFDNDVAQLLVATAMSVGPARAVDSAIRVVGQARVRAAAAELQLLAMPRVLRTAFALSPDLLVDLRDRITALDSRRTVAVPVGRNPLRIAPVALGSLLLGVAVPLVVGGVEDVTRAATTGSWRWASLAALAGLCAVAIRAASVILASGRPLALGRTAAAVSAAETETILGETTAQGGALSRFLLLNGLPRDASEGALERIRRWTVVSSAAASAGLVLTAAVAGARLVFEWPVIALVAAAVVSLASRASVGLRVSAQVPTPAALTMIAGRVAAMSLVLMAAVETVGGGMSVAVVAAASSLTILLVDGLGLHPNLRPLLQSALLAAAGASVTLAAAASLVAIAAASWLPAIAGIPFSRQLRRQLGQ